MRLGFPRITSLQSEDGTASIAFQSTSMDRDTGGYRYLFRLAAPSRETEVRATIARVTGAPAGKQFEAETGNNLWSLKIQDAEKYVEKYAEEHGNIFEVRIFAVPPETSGNDIVALRDAFCRLLFECWSSYRYNNADATSDPAGRYPDTINFRPYDVDRRFHVTLRDVGWDRAASDDERSGRGCAPRDRRQAAGRRQVSMNISFDKANKRATDLDSGMAVTWLRDDYPSERRDFWMLAWKGEEREFPVSWDTGYAKIINARPDTSYEEVIKLGDELKLWEYRVPMVTSLQDMEFLDNIDVFIALFSVVARHRRPTENVHVIFKPFEVPEKYHREASPPRGPEAGQRTPAKAGSA